jgi:hypothetical protein
VLTGIIGLAAFLVTGNDSLSTVSIVLATISLIWAGSALRKAM